MHLKAQVLKARKACSRLVRMGRFTGARPPQWREAAARYSLMAAPIMVVIGTACIAGCTIAARRDAPPNLISTAEPVGFTTDVRILSADLTGFDDRSSKFLQ